MWIPAVINTSKIGFSDYVFIPDSGQCAVDTIITIEIVNKIEPIFAAIGPFCQNSIPTALPMVSENGITGTWEPDTIDTSVAGFINLKFTPDDEQCAAKISIDVEIITGNHPCI